VVVDGTGATSGMAVIDGVTSSSSPAQQGPPQSPTVLKEERVDERDRVLNSRS
jgi:hypothetical protein